MMTHAHVRIAVTLVTMLATRPVAAEPLFASPPHAVADGGRHEIVLFLNEAPSGALASRGPDGSFEVRVPRTSVDASIQGQDFGVDGWGNAGDAVRHLVVAAGPKGDTRIRLEPSVPIGGVDAHTADDPPRLVIELLAAGPTASVVATRSPKPTGSPKPSRTAAPKATATKAAAPRATSTAARATGTATARPRPSATPRPAGTPVPTATAKSEPLAIAATVLTAMAPPAAATRETNDLPAAAIAPLAAAPAPPAAGASAAPGGLGCLWQRVAGRAFCAADPKAPAYVGDRTVTAMASSLARGREPEPEDAAAVETPAMAFLLADHAFITRAAGGKLLPVIDAYRQALREHPEFPEAWRARLNIALAYRAMEFRVELGTVAREAAVDPTAGVVRALAGDVAVGQGQLAAAENDYRAAADGGGAGPCFAARGRARVALAAGDAARAGQELAPLGALCPSAVVTDPETVWVRARLALANRDPATARTMLEQIRSTLGREDQGAVIADLGAAAEAAGDGAAARKSYEQLLGGDYGARAARQGTVRLAILDGTGGDVDAGLKRLERLTPEASDPARRILVLHAARTALARGDVATAIATLHDGRIDPARLALEDQLMIAEAYQQIGLTGEAERVLAAARTTAGASPPDTLFAARGAVALARRDAAGALAIADAWTEVRGRNPGALALRARALAANGDALGAHAAVAAAVMEDGGLTRSLALDVAESLREHEPAAALALAREAFAAGDAPELPASRAAAGLAMLGALAEAAGDEDAALAAYTSLSARYGGEPVAADAAYRAARLAARRLPAKAAAAYDEAARSKDALARRVAGAAREYEAIVRPLGGGVESR